MKICLLGATGRTGKLVLEKALQSGHEVACLARNISRIEPRDGLSVMEGETTHEQDLKRALTGCQGVISALNVSRHSDFPWSRLRTPPTLLSDTMKQLLPLVEENGIQRLVVCSAWGVAETAEDIPGWFSWFIRNSNIGAAYRDHERQEKLIETSAVPWTIVRPVGLTNSTRPEQVRESLLKTPKPRLTISRESVANYLVGALENVDLIGRKVVVSRE